MSTANQKPNHAFIVFPRTPGNPDTAKTSDTVQGFISHGFTAGVLSFEFADGSVIAYGTGHWASVEMTHYSDVVKPDSKA